MANERRIVELVLKAIGDAELKRMTAELVKVRQASQASQKSLDDMERAGRRLGTSIRTLFTGWVANAVLQTFIQKTGEAVESLADLSDEAGGGSKEFEQFSKAAQAFTSEMDEVSKAVDVAVKQIVVGMLPALIGIAKSFADAVKAGGDFTSVGKAIGDALVWITSNAAGAIAYINALRLSVENLLAMANEAKRGFGASLRLEPEEAETHFRNAAEYGKASQIYFQNAANFAAAARNSVVKNYQDAQKITGRGTAKPGDDKGRSGGASRTREAKDETDAFTISLKDYQRALSDTVKTELDRVEALNKTVLELNRAADPLSSYLEGLRQLAEAKAHGGLTAAAAAAEEKRLTDEYNRQRDAALENSEAYQAQERRREQEREALERLQSQWGFVADAMSDATYAIIAGTEKTSEAVKRMVATIASELLRLSLIKLANKLLGGFFEKWGVGPIESAAGNAFGATGVISVPTLHGVGGGGIGVLGEAGPEAVMPLRRGPDGKLGVDATGVNVTVNNNVPAAAIGVRQTDQGLQIDVIERQLADRVRRGGSSLPGALEGTYGTGRYASAY